MTASLQHALRAAGMAVACAFVTTLAWGQAVTLTPSPTGLHEEVTLTIDVGQSEQFGLKSILEANPDLPVYIWTCLLYTSPSPRDRQKSRMPSSA